MSSPIFLSIEGVIGSGKSSFISTIRNSYIGEQFGIYVIEEPIQSCIHFHNENILELFYQNPHEYAFQFQLLLLISRLKAYSQCLENIKTHDTRPVLIIMERSVYSDIEVFATLYHIEGHISLTNYKLLNYVLNSHSHAKLDAVIFLNASYNTILQRIIARGRTGEINNITNQYQKKIHNQYQKYLRTLSCPHTVIQVDSCYFQPASPGHVKGLMDQVNKFLISVVKFKSIPVICVGSSHSRQLEILKQKSEESFTDSESDNEEKPNTVLSFLRKMKK